MADKIFISFIFGLIFFILFLIAHVIVFRRRKQAKPIKALFKIFFILTIVYFLFESIFLHMNQPSIYLSGFLIYFFLFIGYCQFFGIIERSITIRLMVEIFRSGNKSLTDEELKSRYNPRELLTRRLKDLERNNYIRLIDSQYYTNTIKGRIVAGVFRYFKNFYNIGKGG